MTEVEVLEKAIATYGKLPQVFMAIEEMSELIQALSKNFRGKENLDNVAEEIADVEIMIDQLKLIFKVESECQEIRFVKIKRLKDAL